MRESGITEATAKRLILVAALETEVYGMRAANTQRELDGQDLDFVQENFDDMAKYIREVALKTDEQISKARK